jgi:hypothetical protein
MIKWPITYTDYNGETHTEDFYFNLNRAEVMEMNFDADGAYGEYLQRIVEQHDARKIGNEFRNLIIRSYGEKSPDGRRFIKSDDLTEAFVQSEAYAELYMQLASSSELCEKFVKGILPKQDTADSAPNLENHMSLV